MSTKTEAGTTRRDFFKAAGVGAGALGAAAVTLKAGQAQAAGTDVDGQGGLGYRETAAVKQYYALARF